MLSTGGWFFYLSKDKYDLIKKRHFPFYLSLLAIVAVPILIDIYLKSLWPDLHWRNAPFHSAMETMGALIAIFMASILLLKQKKGNGGKIYLLSLGFLSMGILDGFHAISKPGESFVLLHSLASLIGGFWFVVIWVPSFTEYLSKKNSIPWIVALGSLLCSIWFYLLPETLPTMIHNGEFTTSAITINTLAGIMFLIATFRFLLDFNRCEEIELYMFACMSLLFGIAELTFYKSSIWDSGWWLWHLLRLLAYILVLFFIVHQYIRIVAMQRESEEKFKSFTEQSITGVYLLQDGDFKYVNPKFADIFGYTTDECLEKMFLPRLVYPEDLAKVKAQIKKRETGKTKTVHYTFRGLKKSGEIIHVEIYGSSVMIAGKSSAIGTILDISDRKLAEQEKEKLIFDLQKAFEDVKQLSGLIPICSNCKKIRDDKGYWKQIEKYISEKSDAKFSHGICNECSESLYGNEDWYVEMKEAKNKKT